MKRMTNVLRKFHLMKEPPESEMRQRLKAELFACNSGLQYGFPNKPTAMAHDGLLELLAVGSKSGNIRIYGKPGVELMASHSSYIGVTHIHFLCGQGRFVTLCNDNSIHLWQVELRDGRSVLEEVKGITFDASKLKRVMTCCFTETYEYLMLATDAGNIHQLDVCNFKLTDKVVYRDSLVLHAPDELRANSGCICSLERHPTKPTKFLVGFSRGLIVLFDIATMAPELTYNASLNLESLSFYNEGEDFVSAHIDGSYITWSSCESTRPKEQANTPYGPFPCKPIKKILWNATQTNPLVIFSGGMPRASHGDRHTVTVIQGSEHVVFDLTSKIIDFILIISSSSQDSIEQYTVLVLAEEELVAIDLTSRGWPLHRLPYLDSIHASTILSASHVANVPSGLWNQLIAVGNQQYTNYSTAEWPIRGGKLSPTDVPARDLLMTGHEDGTLRFWDVSSSCMRLVYKLSLSSMFGDDMSMSFDPCRNLDIEDEWPPFRRVGVYDPFSDDLQLSIQKSVLSCSDDTLFVSGSTGQVVVLNFSTVEQRQTVKVIPMHIVEENDRGLWRGRNPSKVKDGELKFASGFQPVFMIQIYPPASCTALAVNANRALVALGTSHGFGVVDYHKEQVLYAKSTLEPLLVDDLATLPHRHRSIKKSVRDSFRRLRNGKVSLRRRSRSHAGDTMRSADDERPHSQPVSLITSAAGSRSCESEAENDLQLIEFHHLPTGPTSSRASLAALTPPATPRRTAANKRLDLRSADGLTSSVVRSLHFCDTLVVDGENIVPSLWVGTNGGIVFIHHLVYMMDAKDQGPIQCRVFLAKQIHLRHRSPVISIGVVDRTGHLVSSTKGKDHETEALAGGHQAVICTEQQIKMFSLPSLKTTSKCRVSMQSSVKLRQANLVEFRSRSDEEYIENCVLGVTSSAELHIFSLPSLTHQLKVDKFDVDGSLNASLFTENGEYFFLRSPSEYVRQSLSARINVQPQVVIELVPGSRLPLHVTAKAHDHVDRRDDQLAVSVAPSMNGSGAEDDNVNISTERLSVDNESVTGNGFNSAPIVSSLHD